MSNNVRGVIVTPKFEFDGRTLCLSNSKIDAVALREYLLYWDKIDFPSNNILHLVASNDDQFLIDVGVMSRTDIRFNNFRGNIGDAYIKAQLEALKIRSKEDPGLWTMAQNGSTLFLPPELSHETRSIEIELYKALPVPSESVSLGDILKFKDYRRDELLAFRAAMDQLYLEVIASPDTPRAKTVVLNKIERTLEDLHKVSNESWVSKIRSCLKVEINLPALATHALAGVAICESIGVSPSLGAAIGVVGAAIKFELTATRIANGLPHELKDFAYLHRVEQELNG